MNCKDCKYYVNNNYCEELDLTPCIPDIGCDYWEENKKMYECFHCLERTVLIVART